MNLVRKIKEVILNNPEDSLIWLSIIFMALLLLILTVFNEPIFNYLVEAIDDSQSSASHTGKSVDDANKSSFDKIVVQKT